MEEMKARNRLNPVQASTSKQVEEEDDDDDEDDIGPRIPDNQDNDDDEDDEEEAIGPSIDFNEKEDVTKNYKPLKSEIKRVKCLNRFKDVNKLLPISHEATMIHGSKTVTSVTIDPNGNRLATGGYDYEVKLWDFSGMDSSMKSYRSFEPFER